MSTFDTFKDLISDVSDDYKKALDDLLDRDDDKKDKDKKKDGDAALAALAKIPGLAGLPLGAVQALVDAGPAAPALAGLMAANPLAAAGNPLAALTSGAAANPLAALGGLAGGGHAAFPAARNPLDALGGLGGLAGAAGDAAGLAEALLTLPAQIAKLTEAVSKLLDLLPGATAAAPARK